MWVLLARMQHLALPPSAILACLPALQKMSINCAVRMHGVAAACASLQRLTLRNLHGCSTAFFSGLEACNQLSHLTMSEVQLDNNPDTAPSC